MSPKRKDANKVHSHCVQIGVGEVCRDALTVLSNRGEDGALPMVLIPGPRASHSLIFQVPSGVTCLGQCFGKDIGVLDPGLACRPAFYRIAYVVSQQTQIYDAPVQESPTSDNVRVNVDVTVMFSVTDAYKFIYNLGVRNFDDFLGGTVDEGIRMLVRKHDHKTIYQLRGSQADGMLKRLNDIFLEDYGVCFTDVKVTSVWLPDALAGYLESASLMEKKMDKLKRKNEYDRLEIEQDADMKVEEIKRRSEQLLVTEAGKKKRAELEFDQQVVKTEEDGSVAMIEAQSKAEVMLKETQTMLDRTSNQLEAARITEVAKAEAAGTALKIKADMEEEKAIIAATSAEEEMVCEADSIKHDASAEKEASRCLIDKRRHDLQLREKSIIARLAEAGKFNLVGTPGDKVLSAMLNGSFSKK